ncbi:hypothetical protein [Pseudomonas syringae]|uniref:hypothetical protein n=1 Tax=Pseudomonas syringae TaxID=317 RepID=UPI001F1AFEDC|nr:hypothetical protein [Pseudomonas syringae]MCF5372009.1 hypothetical protein [Pseudomonas syringae]
MSIAPQASPASQAPVAALSTLMYAAGDEVKAKSRMLPFWMTVISVNQRNGYCQCNFGSTGNYAGNFHQSELTFHGGKLLDQ